MMYDELLYLFGYSLGVSLDISQRGALYAVRSTYSYNASKCACPITQVPMPT